MRGGSIHFGTENLIFVPAGDALRLYDLYRWRVARLRAHAARIRLRAGAAERVVESIRSLLADYLRTPAGRARPDAVREEADRFVRALVGSGRGGEPPVVSGEWLAGRTAPAHLTLWTRLSDAPVESYFEEDYDKDPTGDGGGIELAGPTGRVGIPLYGSILLTQFDGAEVTLAESGPDAAFLLEIENEQDLLVEVIDPRKALPIVEEYCGAGGASNRGNAANYSLHSRLSGEKLGCAPLHRVGERGFATLYLHYETDLTYDVLIRIRGKRLALAARTIRSLGYSLVGEGPLYQIWEREDGGDILHVYMDLPGRESEMAPVLSPFVLAVKARGGFDPAERSRLIAELAKPDRREGGS